MNERALDEPTAPMAPPDENPRGHRRDQNRGQSRDRAREAVRLAAVARHAATNLEVRGVACIAVTFVDNSGITRVKGVPIGRLDHAVIWGVGASTSFDTFGADDSTVTGRFAGGPVGDLRLHPDLDRLTALAAQPGWAWAPADRRDQFGGPHPQDGRALVRAQAALLAERGITALMAFEVEWTVSPTGTDDFTPACSGPAYGMTRVVELSDYLRDVLTALIDEGLVVEQIHPEYAAGQFEVSVAGQDPLAAADTCVLVKETVRGVSARHGLRASFAPKVRAEGVGNGGHVHLSLWSDEPPTEPPTERAPGAEPGSVGLPAPLAAGPGTAGRAAVNLMSGGDGPFGLTAVGEAFAAGILGRLPALMALGAPSVASYLRLAPSSWAGAYACWGRENREAALRMIPGPPAAGGEVANLEVKCFDLAANPYLAVAGLLAAGRAGLDEVATLPEPVDVDPATLDPAERHRRGISRLPTRLADAVSAFEADEVLRDACGPELHDTIIVLRRAEIARFAEADADPAAIVAATRWRY